VTRSERQLPLGALYLSLGQGIFLVIGFVLHAFLARWLAPTLYGVFGVAMTVLVWVEIIVNNGVPSALQRFLPDRSLSEHSVRQAAARCQVLISVGLFLVFTLAAPWLALLLRDPALTGPLRLAFLDILAMGAYAYYRGVLNGWRAFEHLSLAITAYSLTKLLAIFLLVYLGLGIEGALIGNVIASLGGLAGALFWTRRDRTRNADDPQASLSQVNERQVLAFVLPTALFSLASNILLGLDLMGVKALLPDADQVGYYTAAVNLANAPRLVLLAFSFTLLPSLSHAIAAQNQDQARRYLRQTIRLLAMVLLPILALVVSTAGPLVSFVFSQAYLPAAPILSVLIFTYAAYTVYITLVSALLAENRPGRALAIPIAFLPVAIGTIWLGVSRLGTMGAAYASLLSVAGAMLIVVAYVWHRFRPPLAIRSLGRIALASLVIGGLAWWWSPTGLSLIAGYGLLLVLYLILLLVLGELRKQDLALVTAWFARLTRRKRSTHVTKR
jgi:O-antigen/teichoic acid export membrane protein